MQTALATLCHSLSAWAAWRSPHLRIEGRTFAAARRRELLPKSEQLLREAPYLVVAPVQEAAAAGAEDSR